MTFLSILLNISEPDSFLTLEGNQWEIRSFETDNVIVWRECFSSLPDTQLKYMTIRNVNVTYDPWPWGKGMTRQYLCPAGSLLHKCTGPCLSNAQRISASPHCPAPADRIIMWHTNTPCFQSFMYWFCKLKCLK